MKTWISRIAVTLVAIFLACDFIRDFIDCEPIHYFTEQPLQLLSVAGIAIGGSLILFVFSQQSLQVQHMVKLFATAMVASCCTLFAGWLLYAVTDLSSKLGVLPGPIFVRGAACFLLVAALFWFQFYRFFKAGRMATTHTTQSSD